MTFSFISSLFCFFVFLFCLCMIWINICIVFSYIDFATFIAVGVNLSLLFFVVVYFEYLLWNFIACSQFLVPCNTIFNYNNNIIKRTHINHIQKEKKRTNQLSSKANRLAWQLNKIFRSSRGYYTMARQKTQWNWFKFCWCLWYERNQ